MLDEHTAYIKINRFSATVYKEFKEALSALLKEGATQLVLDLRDNPGGYLDQVISIADELLNDNKLIVYTIGSHANKTTYKAESAGMFENGKLAVLINEGSASASEILAGAIQDWDRGIIVGRRSFGKGLVQEPYEMNDGSEIRLTIAKYYTPSGRCIQRSFSNGREAYSQDYENRLQFDRTGSQPDAFIPADTTRYFTANKRVVYGGGGINPDVFAIDDTDQLPPHVENRLYSNELRTAIWKYYLQNREKLTYNTIKDFTAGFRDENEIMYQYLMTFETTERKEILSSLSKTANLYRFNTYIKSQIGRMLFRNNGYYAIVLQEDQVVRKAKDLLNSKSYLAAINRK
jgi:carboxyl-terminal processing protease